MSKSHTCTVCKVNHSFSRKRALDEHVRNVRAELKKPKICQCISCLKSFTTEKSLRSHIRMKHPNNNVQSEGNLIFYLFMLLVFIDLVSFFLRN
jgi:hypothetical protein